MGTPADQLALEMQEQLLAAARAARLRAYAPYSQFAIGAAALLTDRRIFSGVNVENASYGLSLCAERSAIAAAVAGGMRPGELAAVALVGEYADEAAGAAAAAEYVTPCGACRQVLSEFAAAGCTVFTETLHGERAVWRLDELLPQRFRLPGG